MRRVLRRKLLKPALLAAFRHAHLDARASALRQELLERRGIPCVPWQDDLRWDRRRPTVVLETERLQHRRDVLPTDVLEVEGIAVDHLPVAERKDLNDRTVTLDGEADHVDRADRATISSLALGEVLHGAQAIPVARCILEPLLRGRVAHPLLELALNRLGVAGEELDHLVDDRAVVLLRHVADAGGETPLDVEVQTRDP